MVQINAERFLADLHELRKIGGQPIRRRIWKAAIG
jgi:hypothetical protein